MDTPGSYAKYACDACHARKASCTRELPQCARCKAQEGTTCAYSRYGILRRNRKRKAPDAAIPVRTVLQDGPPAREQVSEPLTQAIVTERLEKLAGRKHASLREVAGLMGEYHGFWQDAGAFGKLAEDSGGEYHQFEEEVKRGWGKDMVAALKRERLLDESYEVENLVDEIAATELYGDVERAWWVMFWSVALGKGVAAGSLGQDVLKRVKGNLWLAFNDVRFLLQPSILNVHALAAMVIFAESVLTPLASWTLVSKACIMLLDLGVGTHSYTDPIVKRQRDTLFWRLSSMDKSLSIILSKTPVFQRELIRRMQLPSLETLLSTRPRYPLDGMPVLFEAHYEHQIALLSRLQMSVWHCLPGQETHDLSLVREQLKTWYTEAKEVLEASALVEKPLLSPSGLVCIELRLKTLLVHFSFLDILLTVASRDLRPQCISPAQSLLDVLPQIGELLSAHSELPSILLWEWIHYSMIAFGKLWGQILSRGVSEGAQSEKILKDLHHVPSFLAHLQHRHPMVAKLKSIAEKILHHVNVIYRSGVGKASHLESEHGAAENGDEDIATIEENADEHFDVPSTSTEATFEGPFDDLPPLPDDFLFDPGFDWFAWGEQVF